MALLLLVCSCLYVGLGQSSLQRVQIIQNIVAHLLTSTKKHEDITPVLKCLY